MDTKYYLVQFALNHRTGVNTVSDTINKFLQKPEIPFADKLELKAIERRLNTLVLPLNHCIIASRKLVITYSHHLRRIQHPD